MSDVCIELFSDFLVLFLFFIWKLFGGRTGSCRSCSRSRQGRFLWWETGSGGDAGCSRRPPGTSADSYHAWWGSGGPGGGGGVLQAFLHAALTCLNNVGVGLRLGEQTAEHAG